MIDDPTKALPPDSPAAFSLERGRSRRADVPRRLHGDWEPAHDRPDIVTTLDASNEGRLPDLVPIRIGRMLASPFAFLRGSAAVMANDLADTPHIGSKVQLCGDAHLANFGVFASPERRLVFDVNDFDETYRGPWEWDLKRLAASVVVAARENGFSESTNRDMARLTRGGTGAGCADSPGCARSRSGTRRSRSNRSSSASRPLARCRAAARRSRSRSTRRAARTTWRLSGSCRSPRRAEAGSSAIARRCSSAWRTTTRPATGLAHLRAGYLRSLAPDRRLLVEKHRLLDVALKVVGVGSVGTRCYIALFAGPAGGPLILQVKEARESVLAPVYPRAALAPPGRAGRDRSADHAGRLGQLPRLDEVADVRDRVLRPPAARHEVRRRHRRPARAGHASVRRGLCVGTRPGARAVGQPGRDRRLPRARAARSTRPSPRSRSRTRTRPNATTRHSPRPSVPGGWRPRRGSDARRPGRFYRPSRNF